MHTYIHTHDIHTQRVGSKREGYERRRKEEEEERRGREGADREQRRRKEEGEEGGGTNALTLSLAQSQQPYGS